MGFLLYHLAEGRSHCSLVSLVAAFVNVKDAPFQLRSDSQCQHCVGSKNWIVMYTRCPSMSVKSRLAELTRSTAKASSSHVTLPPLPTDFFTCSRPTHFFKTSNTLFFRFNSASKLQDLPVASSHRYARDNNHSHSSHAQKTRPTRDLRGLNRHHRKDAACITMED